MIYLATLQTIVLEAIPNKTYFIIIGISRQRIKLILFFSTNTLIRHRTLYWCYILLIFNFRKHIYLTCRCCFYHIRDLRRNLRYISLSVAKAIAIVHETCRLDFCNSLLYNIASKDILKLMLGLFHSQPLPPEHVKSSNSIVFARHHLNIFWLTYPSYVSTPSDHLLMLNCTWIMCSSNPCTRFATERKISFVINNYYYQ